MEIIADVRTDQGIVRPNNEDNFYVSEENNILIVADGMGGHASGEIASKMAVDILRDSCHEPGKQSPALIGKYNDEFSELTNKMASAVRLANMAIYEASQSNLKWQGMGTTLSGVFIDGGRLSIAHVGDSRIYLVRAGDIMQLTEDHTLVYEQVKRDMMTEKEAETSKMKHLLTRALGVREDVDVDLDELTLADGDILILCTDGLNTMVSDDDILSAVTSIEEPAAVCEFLVDLANDNGGRDNITIVVACIKKRRWFSSFIKLFTWFRR